MLAAQVMDAVMGTLFLGRRDAAYAPLLDRLGLVAGERVLDAGAGTGWLGRRLARRVGSSGAVVGVEPDGRFVAHAQGGAGASERYVVGTLERLPVGDRAFDAAVTSLVVHHVPVVEQGAAFAELRRVLRPGGRLLVVELARPGRRLVWWGLGWHGCVRASLPTDALVALAREAGFEQIDTGRHGRWLVWLTGRVPE